MIDELGIGVCFVSEYAMMVLAGDRDELENDDSDPNAGRFVRYQFTPQFLKLRTVGAT